MTNEAQIRVWRRIMGFWAGEVVSNPSNRFARQEFEACAEHISRAEMNEALEVARIGYASAKGI